MVLMGSVGSLYLSYIHAYDYTVMGNELDKIEQNGDQVAKHMRISEAAGQQLKEDVKVGILSHGSIMCKCKIECWDEIAKSCLCRCMHARQG